MKRSSFAHRLLLNPKIGSMFHTPFERGHVIRFHMIEDRYKVLGKPASCDGEVLFLFKLNDFELFVSGKRKGSYLPSEWRDYFGVPAKEHEGEYKVNLADGYITTDKV